MMNTQGESNYIRQTLEEYDIELTDEEVDEYFYYIDKIKNNIPLWGNCGYTNKELLLDRIEKC